MNIGGQVIRLIERADPHEAEQGTAAKIIAPQGYATLRTAGDVLTRADTIGNDSNARTAGPSACGSEPDRSRSLRPAETPHYARSR